MPEGIEWFFWRIWQDKRASLQEIDEHWTLEDLEIAHVLMDLEADSATDAHNKAIREAKR